MARAIKPVTIASLGDNEPTEVDQIVFYQSGVGTGTLDSLIGGKLGHLHRI